MAPGQPTHPPTESDREVTTTTSVELRINNREVVCDWGVISDPPIIRLNSETETTTVENVGPLVLVSTDLVDNPGPEERHRRWSDLSTFYADGDRRFMRITAANGSWIWELFDAHWEDGEPSNVYIGRWRD